MRALTGSPEFLYSSTAALKPSNVPLRSNTAPKAKAKGTKTAASVPPVAAAAPAPITLNAAIKAALPPTAANIVPIPVTIDDIAVKIGPIAPANPIAALPIFIAAKARTAFANILSDSIKLVAIPDIPELKLLIPERNSPSKI